MLGCYNAGITKYNTPKKINIRYHRGKLTILETIVFSLDIRPLKILSVKAKLVPVSLH